MTGLGVRESDADNYLSDLNHLMQEYQIDTELRVAHFLAQVLHESGHMKVVEENLNYSEQSLLRVFDLDVLQAAANNGEVCIIVAQRRNLNHSGHITAVAPEHDGFGALRSSAGEVLRPLESQVGRENHRFFVSSRRWWQGGNFRNHGFWRHI